MLSNRDSNTAFSSTTPFNYQVVIVIVIVSSSGHEKIKSDKKSK